MSANFEWSESKGCFLAASPLPSDSSGACNFRELGRCSVSFTANAKHLKGLVANSDVFAMITRRKSPVNFSTVPSLYLMCVHRLIRRLGAPFTRRRLPLSLSLQSSLPSPLLRSRLDPGAASGRRIVPSPSRASRLGHPS